MKRLVLQFVLAIALTVPVFLGLTSFDALIAWMYGDVGWKLLIPLFRLYGAVGVEGEDEVIAGVLLIASFALSLGVVGLASIVLHHRHVKRHPP
jgi:hypothetical protein